MNDKKLTRQFDRACTLDASLTIYLQFILTLSLQSK